MTDTHTTVQIPDAAVQAMPERIYAMNREDTKHCIVAFEEFSADHIEYVRADLAASHLSAPCAVEVKPSSFVNAANILASDAPHIVVQKLDAAYSQIVTKPVDVAAVRRQALDEAAVAAMSYLAKCDSFSPIGVANHIRALYASPAPAADLRADAARYQYLRSRDVNTIRDGGVFAGVTPENYVINGVDLDCAIDATLNVEASNDK